MLVVKQNALFRAALQLLTVLPKHAVALSSAQSMYSHSRTAEEPNSLLAAGSPTCIYKSTLQFSQNKFKSSHLLEQWSQTGLMRPCFIVCNRNCHQDRDWKKLKLLSSLRWWDVSTEMTALYTRFYRTALSRKQQMQLLWSQLSLATEERGFGIPQAEGGQPAASKVLNKRRAASLLWCFERQPVISSEVMTWASVSERNSYSKIPLCTLKYWLQHQLSVSCELLTGLALTIRCRGRSSSTWMRCLPFSKRS